MLQDKYDLDLFNKLSPQSINNLKLKTCDCLEKSDDNMHKTNINSILLRYVIVVKISIFALCHLFIFLSYEYILPGQKINK